MSKGVLLIVDDETAIRELLTSYFEEDGYQTFSAEGGHAALKILEDVKIDVLISDVVMPGLNGIDLLKILTNEYPMTKAIMMTGFVAQSHLLRCMRYNAEDVIFKPFENLSEIKEAVERCLAHLNRWGKRLNAIQAMKPI